MWVLPEHSSKVCESNDPATLPHSQILRFVNYLREHGFLIGLGELDAMLRITLSLKPEHYPQLKACWRGIACSSIDQWKKYPDLFEAFWFPQKRRGSTRSSGIQRKNKSLQQLVAQMHADMEVGSRLNKPSVGLDLDGHSSGISDQQKAMGGASRVDPFHVDAKQWLPEDTSQLESLMRPLEQRLRKKIKRKWIRTHQSQRIDIRATLRGSLSTHGELIQLKHRQRDQSKPRLYVLIDVSQSMESHAPFFLRVGRVFCQLLRARVFVFHTRIAEISSLLNRNSGRIQEKINAVTFGFGGGTKIASNLDSFLKVYAARALGSRDLVYVLSDGYDTDPAEETARAIRAIRQRGAKVFWLHPNKAKPESDAILESAHLINRFLALDSVQSLENLVKLN